MKLWEVTVSQTLHGTVCVWMPDDAGIVEACAEATRYAGVLEAKGALSLDLTPDLPQVHDAFPEETGAVSSDPESPLYMPFNLDPEFAGDPREA